MANTYTQIHIQVVFAVKNRKSMINDSWKDRLFKYITAIIQNKGHKVLQINGGYDHVHILFGMRPNQALSELMKFVKQDSSRWINQNKLTRDRFSWQAGYGAFSYSRNQISTVCEYIKNQEAKHKKESFLEEYVSLLKAHEIDYDSRYLFEPV
jgi:REP element-mobilizing transposase RayT